MKYKRAFALLFVAGAFALLFTVGAAAAAWWEDCSDTVAAYPLSPPAALGDLDRNGIVDAADARETLRLAVGLEETLPQDLAIADCNKDKELTAEDARLTLRCAVGLEETKLPAADDGAYRLRVSSRLDQLENPGAPVPPATNADRIGDVWEPGGSLPLWRLRDTADAAAFAAAFPADATNGFDNIDVPTFLRRYDEAFFADRDLFICYAEEGSGSDLQAVYDPTLANDGMLTFYVGSVSAQAGTCDEAYWFLFLPLEKTTAAACAAFDCRRAPGEILPYAQYAAAKKGETKWTYAAGRLLPESTNTLTLRAEDEIDFALKNAQDGGYLWEYEADTPVGDYGGLFTEVCDDALYMKEELVCSPSPLSGAPGLHLYTVKAMRPGVYTLRFSLKRSWEPTPIATRIVTVTVT